MTRVSLMLKRNGQSTMEYTILIIIVLGALVATSDYIKRGIQGRWRSAVDDLGDQYDPRFTNASINYSMCAISDTQITTMNANGGFWTIRKDSSDSAESKKGYISVGGY